MIHPAPAADGIEQFVLSVVPHVLDSGQGYDSQSCGDVAVELAWYREDDYTWGMFLAVESKRRRVETPDNTSFRCTPGFDRAEYEQNLAALLKDRYAEMLAQA